MSTTIQHEPPDSITMALPLLNFSPQKTSKNEWKSFPKNKTPFLAIPPEIQLKIFTLLNPIDSTCLSMVNAYIYKLSPPIRHPLNIGSPDSYEPIISFNCRHCLPVLYYPSHCQLHHHLRPVIPPSLKYCSGVCSKFTACEDSLASDRETVCGTCGVLYRRCYERGRRMLDMKRPGEYQQRLRKWYNDPDQDPK